MKALLLTLSVLFLGIATTAHGESIKYHHSTKCEYVDGKTSNDYFPQKMGGYKYPRNGRPNPKHICGSN